MSCIFKISLGLTFKERKDIIEYSLYFPIFQWEKKEIGLGNQRLNFIKP